MAEIKAHVTHAFGYDGGALVMPDEETIMHACGNGIKLMNTNGASHKFLWNQKLASTSVAAMALNARAKLLAVCEQSSVPGVTLYTWPEQEAVAELGADSPVNYNAVALSRDGKRMVTVASAADSCNVAVWDLTTRAKLPGCELSLPMPASKVAFNPRTADEISIIGKSAIYFAKIAKRFDDFKLTHTKASLEQGAARRPSVAVPGADGTLMVDPPSAEPAEVPGEQQVEAAAKMLTDSGAVAPTEKWLAAAWTVDGHLLASNAAGMLVKLNPASGQAVWRRAPPGGATATAIAIAREDYVLGCDDGTVRWMSADSGSIGRVVVLDPNAESATVVSSMCPTPSYGQLIVGVETGAIYKMHLDSEDEEEEKNQASALLGNLNEGRGDDASDGATLVADYHSGSVFGVAMLPRSTPSDNLFASVGQDGTLRVYDFVRKAMLAKQHISPATSAASLAEAMAMADAGVDASPPAALTTVACHPSLPIMAVGDTQGNLKLNVFKRTTQLAGNIMPLVSRRLHSTVVSSVLFSPVGNMVATIGLDGRICLIECQAPSEPTDPSAFPVVAYATLPGTSTSTKPIQMAWRGNHELLIAAENGRLYSLQVRSPNNQGKGMAEDISSRLTLRLVTPAASGIFVNVPAGCGNDVDDNNISIFMTFYKTKLVALYDLDWPAGGSGGTALDADSARLSEPQVEFMPHDRGITCGSVSPQGDSAAEGARLITTGCGDGSIAVTLVQNGTGVASTNVRLHSGAVAQTAMALDGMAAISAGLDGTIYCTVINTPGLDRAGAAVMSSSEKAVLEALILFSVSNQAATSRAETKGVDEDDEEEQGKEEEPKTFFDELEEHRAAEASTTHHAARITFRKEVSMLAYRLKELLSKNEKVPDIEKLERDEFCVDLEGRDNLLKQNAERALAVRRELERENADREIIAKRIKAQCWDTMRVQAKSILAFVSGMVVYNFPIRKALPAEKSKLKKVMTLRRIELREIRAAAGSRGAWPGLLDELPPTVNWLLNAGKLKPCTDPVAMFAAAEATEGKEGKDDEDAADMDAAVDVKDVLELGPLDLLYHPGAVRAPNQKRIQIMLLKELITQVEEAYNKRFDAVMSSKDDEMEKIGAKNKRIEEIMTELKEHEDYFKPKWHPDEQPETVLEVSHEEIGFEKYISEAQRRREAEAARQRQEAGKDKDNAPERALMEMMNGTLEAKDDLALLEEGLQREPWMDELTEEEMTDEQRKALADFEAKQKQFLEEKAKHRKALQQESKKLQQEVKDLVAHFDNHLKDLHKTYLETKEYINAQELYMARLAMAVQEREDGAVREEKLLTKLDELVDVREMALTKHEDFEKRFEEYKQNVEALIQDDKAKERSFKHELMEVAGALDPDVYKNCHTLFKQRNNGNTSSFGGGSSGHGMSSIALRRGSMSRRRTNNPSVSLSKKGSSVDAMKQSMKEALKDVESRTSVLDPFADQDVVGPTTEQKQQQDREEALQPLSWEGDVPEGFDISAETWQCLQELRTAKIQLELDIATQQEELAKMDNYLGELERELETAEDSMRELENERELLLEQRAIAGSNLELLVRLQQGQDEMDAEAVVTDYSDALLLHRDVVGSINTVIRSLGTEKVATLTRIKDFNKEINHMLWEQKHLNAVLHDAEEHYTDLHMLRVTKTLQMFIKGGDIAERQRKDLEKADAKLAHMKKAHARAMAKYKTSANKVLRQVRDRAKENNRLKDQMRELESAVTVRESIHRSRSQARGDAGADAANSASARMKAITTRRKLIDLARAQTEEIEFLRQELDRLRQATFPSFAHASRMSYGNVDEYM